MFKKALLQTDLTPTQAEILDFLYQNKEAKASVIAKEIKRSRAIVYKELEELANLGIIEKEDKPNQVSIFRANHPSQLEKLMEIRENKLKKDKELLNNYLPDIISSFNLVHNKPGIKFYEGIEGVKKVTNDTLNATETIYTYADAEKVQKYINEINQEYLAKRKKQNVQKKLLLVDSEFSRNYMKNYDRTATEARFIKNISEFATVMQIYDNKISYITIEGENKLGIIIEDENIYKMHRTLFESHWENAEKN